MSSYTIEWATQYFQKNVKLYVLIRSNYFYSHCLRWIPRRGPEGKGHNLAKNKRVLNRQMPEVQKLQTYIRRLCLNLLEKLNKIMLYSSSVYMFQCVLIDYSGWIPPVFRYSTRKLPVVQYCRNSSGLPPGFTRNSPGIPPGFTRNSSGIPPGFIRNSPGISPGLRYNSRSIDVDYHDHLYSNDLLFNIFMLCGV